MSTVKKLSPPPKGWKLVRSPSTARNGLVRVEPSENLPTLKVLYTSLMHWCSSNRVDAIPHKTTMVRLRADDMTANIWSDFALKPVKTPVLRVFQTAGTGCPSCHRRVHPGSIYCSACGSNVRCLRCNASGLPLKNGVCGACLVKCASKGCSIYLDKSGDTRFCPKHDPRQPCFYCSRRFNVAKLTQKNDRSYCSECLALFCPKCDSFGQDVRGTGASACCRLCREASEYNVVHSQEGFAPQDLPRSGSMVIPSLPERPIRTITVEVEYDAREAAWVARYLFQQGITTSPTIANYSHQGGKAATQPCVLKSDGSVSGGELVMFMFNMDDDKHAKIFLDVLVHLKKLQQAGKISFSVNAGGHIHHDAHNMSVADGFALVTVFNYLEDTLHRIGGAGDSDTHRKHRALYGNNHGSAAVLKGPFGSKRGFGSKMRSFARAALNIQHFVNAMANCTCGAREFEAWAECTCTLPKNTIEWRLFNPAITPRTLHAWIALIQSCVAYSTAIEVNEADFPAFDFKRSFFKDLDPSMHDKTRERLRWIFTHLPLNADEKDSLLWVIKRSELGVLGAVFLDTLPALAPAVAFDLKPEVRNPNKRTIVMKPPSNTSSDTPLDTVVAAGSVRTFRDWQRNELGNIRFNLGRVGTDYQVHDVANNARFLLRSANLPMSAQNLYSYCVERSRIEVGR
jgi:hypothetical protein